MPICRRWNSAACHVTLARSSAHEKTTKVKLSSPLTALIGNKGEVVTLSGKLAPEGVLETYCRRNDVLVLGFSPDLPNAASSVKKIHFLTTPLLQDPS